MFRSFQCTFIDVGFYPLDTLYTCNQLSKFRYKTCLSPKQILDAMNQDSELPLNSVRVDGGMTENKLMLQLQADILGIKMGTDI